jgi:hypothetical protein
LARIQVGCTRRGTPGIASRLASSRRGLEGARSIA